MGKNMRSVGLIAVAVIAIAVLAGAAASLFRAASPPPPPGGITLLADNSFQSVLEDIVDAFQRRSNVRIDARFGSSPELLQELEESPGAADLFLPGGAYFVEQAGNLIEDSVQFAWAVPVLLVQGGNPEDIESVADLARPGLEVGVADPNGSLLGRMTPAILEHHGVDREAFEANVVFTSGTDPELGNAIRLGRVDAAIVWESMAHHVLRGDIVPIPPDEEVLAAIAIGLSAGTLHADAAREFMTFLQGRAAQSLFEQYHYATTPPPLGGPEPEDNDDELIETVFG